jgi:hypothetical protein
LGLRWPRCKLLGLRAKGSRLGLGTQPLENLQGKRGMPPPRMLSRSFGQWSTDDRSPPNMKGPPSSPKTRLWGHSTCACVSWHPWLRISLRAGLLKPPAGPGPGLEHGPRGWAWTMGHGRTRAPPGGIGGCLQLKTDFWLLEALCL